MTKLRVGDIEIDGRNVRIGGPLPSPSIRAGASRVAPDEGMLVFLGRLPFSSRTLLTVGGFLAVSGIATVAAALQWSVAATALYPGGLLFSLGSGIGAAGGLKRIATKRPELRHRAALGADADRYASELIGLLSQIRVEQTVPWILSRTGWSEHIVLHALALLAEREEVSELFDTETEEYYYVAGAAFMPRDLETRLRNLHPKESS